MISTMEIGPIVVTPYNFRIDVEAGELPAGFQGISIEADVSLLEAESVSELSNNRFKTYKQGIRGVLTTVVFASAAIANSSGAYLITKCTTVPNINPQGPYSHITLNLVRLGGL